MSERHKFECANCGSRLTRTKTSTSYAGGEGVETHSVAPCVRCIDRALADRMMYVLARVRRFTIPAVVEDADDETGELYEVEKLFEHEEHILALFDVFFSSEAAHKVLRELVEAGMRDKDHEPFSHESHSVVVLHRWIDHGMGVEGNAGED